MTIASEVSNFFESYLLETDEGKRIGSKDKLVVAVSGGPDSLALLHVLVNGGLYPSENLTVAHLDHGLRPESAGEAKFVAQLAGEWGLEYRVGRVEVAEIARDNGLSIETAARQVRYQFLGDVAEGVGATAVATAHNADDQAETVLMHFLRGTGLAGLRGMLPVSPLPGSPGKLLIRPLLTVNRQEIEEYCRQNELDPVWDATNKDTSYFRNRIRHELLPTLREYSPQIDQRLVNMATILAADHELIHQQLKTVWPELVLESGSGWIRIDRQKWLSLSDSLKRLSLRQAVESLRPDLSDLGFQTVEQAFEVAETGQVGSESHLPGGIKLEVGYGTLLITAGEAVPKKPNLPQLRDKECRELPVPGSLNLAGGWRIEASPARSVDLGLIEANQDPWLAFVSLDEGDYLYVRPRAAGERFQPMGLGGRGTKVKKVMIDRKIPADLRSLWPLVANDRHLLWLVGLHQDERARVTADSRLVVRLKATPPKSD
jgi:tRNA(Ile)-lysidine synthase